MSQYNKQPIDFARQLELLKTRGLIVDDEALALSQLHSISYFRLADYLRPMEIDSTTHSFGNNSHFSEAITQYVFDRELRTLVFKVIQDVEIALRTRISHYFSMRHGAFWFMDASLFKNRDIFDNSYDAIRKELARSKEEFIKEHYQNYDDPTMPPSWKTMEVVSFGTLSKLFGNFKDTAVKKQVARDFRLPQYVYLENWMKCAAVLRNGCAHHARIWNRRFPMIPVVPQLLPSPWISNLNFRRMKLYPQLCCLAYMESSIVPNGDFAKGLKLLLQSNPNVDPRAMGFPKDWELEPLWK